MKNRYRNPWAEETLVRGVQFYENDAPAVAEHRGVTVLRLGHQFDYVFAGCCIAQRAGWRRGGEITVIDEILNGDTPVSDGVAAHLTEQGLKPLTYEQYTKDWVAGLRE